MILSVRIDQDAIPSTPAIFNCVALITDVRGKKSAMKRECVTRERATNYDFQSAREE